MNVSDVFLVMPRQRPRFFFVEGDREGEKAVNKRPITRCARTTDVHYDRGNTNNMDIIFTPKRMSNV